MKHFLIIVLVCTILSCTKSGADKIPSDNNKPRMTIIAPAKSEIYHHGDPLCFKGNVIDENTLISVKLKLFKADDMGKPVVEYNYPVSERSLYIEQKTIIPETLDGNCVLQFEATDFGNNRAVSTLNFSSN